MTLPFQFIKKWGIKDKAEFQRGFDARQQYHEIYMAESTMGKIYGKSSEDLLDKIAPIVIKENPQTILDYGCGRSGLIHYFWNDGKRKLFKFDPAIREYKAIKVSRPDMIFCTDVLEHIPYNKLDLLLTDIKTRTKKAIFTISLIKARKKLPNGMNAHITIEPAEFWIELLELFFDKITVIEKDDKGIFLKTW